MFILTTCIFIGITTLVMGFVAPQVIVTFKRIYKESRYLSEYGTDEQLKQRCSSHSVHNNHLLGLALEAADYRAMEEATSNNDEKALYQASYNSVSTEVVDTVLALNGLDPHPGVILGGAEEDNTVIQLSDFKPTNND